MAGITKVGPPEPGARPKKRGLFARIVRRATLGAALFNPAAYRVAEAEQKLEEWKREEPWHGLPAADFSDNQREDAAERMKREDAIRRARGGR